MCYSTPQPYTPIRCSRTSMLQLFHTPLLLHHSRVLRASLQLSSFSLSTSTSTSIAPLFLSFVTSLLADFGSPHPADHHRSTTTCCAVMHEQRGRGATPFSGQIICCFSSCCAYSSYGFIAKASGESDAGRGEEGREGEEKEGKRRRRWLCWQCRCRWR